MLEYLRLLLADLKRSENEITPILIIDELKQKIVSLETAIEVLEEYRKGGNK